MNIYMLIYKCIMNIYMLIYMGSYNKDMNLLANGAAHLINDEVV